MESMQANQIGPDEWEGFLQRPPMVLPRAQAAASIAGKRILITGAGGSIGSALTLAIAAFAPQRIVLLEGSERNLYDIERALRSPHHASFLGSVGDPVLLEEIFREHRPHLVYHAAAFKHVPLMERNPFAAIRNNALATDLLCRMAQKYEAEQFLLLSTDKAADPVSMMGASKRIAELVLLASRSSALQTRILRLGNVLGSEGSIVPLFLQQIASGAALTVTHREICRYFLSTGDAVTLLLDAAYANYAAGILVPDLGQPLPVDALAHYLLAHAAAHNPVVYTQPRPGDKMCETLLSSRERYCTEQQGAGLLRSVESPSPSSTLLRQVLLELESACDRRSREALLSAVLRLVPEYEPSAVLRNGQQAAWETA